MPVISLSCLNSYASINPDIKKPLDAIPSNANMLSHDIQNYLLNAKSTLLLWRIKTELRASEGTFYGILDDECKKRSWWPSVKHMCT